MERPGGGSRADRVLEEWSAVAGTAQRPVDPVLERGPMTRLRGVSLAAAGVAVAVLVAAVWLGRGGLQGGVGGPAATDVPAATPVISPSVAPSTAPSGSPGAGGVADCTAADLEASVTDWTGAAGSRIADVELTNASPHACTLAIKGHPQLVDAKGQVLIDGTTPKASKTIRLASKGTAQTMIEVGNYCGAAPSAPATVAFAFPVGPRLVASPAADSSNAVPPCMGSTVPGSIQMHPWSE